MKPFRKHHLLALLEESDTTAAPLDRLLKAYFKQHRSIGSKDRKEICKVFYKTIKWLGLIDYLAKRPLTWESRLDVSLPSDPPPKTPAHIAVSFPKWLYDKLHTAYGEEATAICLTSNEEAPTTIRVNRLKTTRESLQVRLESASPTLTSPDGLVLPARSNFLALDEFKEGLFEVQDEGSQCVADLIDAHPGDHILDFCAGSGGKSLAFAHKLGGKGQIYLHDVREHALKAAKKRLKRAGVQNAKCSTSLPKQKMDWILLDVPCSGTGTLRRNPGMKWRLRPEEVQELVTIQREIIQKALPLLSPNGKLVYATCSLLPEENEEQLAFMQSALGLRLTAPPFKSLPKPGGMDGFFGATLELIEPS